VIGSALADGTGAWSITSTKLADGPHTITATATDAAGNVSVASGGTPVQIDTAAPAAPVIKLTHDTGTSSSDDLTGNPAIMVMAVSPTYEIDGGSATSAQPVFANDGTSDGRHTVTVTDTDAAGNTASASLTFVLDTQAPVADAKDVNDVAGKTVTGQLAGNDHLGLPISYSLVSDPTHGNLTFNSDGSYSYTSTARSAAPTASPSRVNNGVLDSKARA